MFRKEAFALAVVSLCPGVNPRNGDFTVDQKNGSPVIASWNRPDIRQPTQSQIEAVDTDLIYSGPVSVTPRQARLALLAAGLLDQVEAIIAQSDRPTKITWNNASEIRRDFPLIASLGSALGLSSAQVDALFINAAKL